MKRLCTICARSGSKGVANKNLRELAGKPLLAYSILQAKASNLFQAIAVSSDSAEILDVANRWGVDYLIERPLHLATDQAPKIPVIQHALRVVEELMQQYFDTIVDLDVTSPLRYVSDIKDVVNLLETKQVSNVITGTPAHRSPYFNLVEVNKEGNVQLSKSLSKPIFCRQNAPKAYDLNASIYAWQRKALLKHQTIFNQDTLLYIMPKERSIDIDSELDFQLVELLMNKRGKKIDENIL
ncbi:N-acylneuraminate cytidylyltransferase/CMP-N,N'-diacetyllegionaminic acid synthase [Anaerovirgula multivorans]|uniref:N-acylneuraminate cytidylyltransferase/CMP-N,N'-diacetyllegionaminic acid synthase n=1 Tax=Anaerovirgula multivorans TaxID=312168 RepID=A0A239JA59_9FIRM|nr:acylneuraminate cytidylyltransferase family protein [Anaerovirgula multivorans]SNT02781.1 N-acylneuraminate cytidylyltransferase/CMP-N,N'-diacetyllegionaminic acid synthase [Anaerovirgula multivorans]